MLRWAVGTLLALPVIGGLWGVLLPAFGHFPLAGAHGPTLDPWRDLFATAGIGQAITLSVRTGVLSTLIALMLALLIVGATFGTRAFRWIRACLAPFLAIPHAAAAFGIGFLIAPSGWIVRILTNWDRPPDVLIPQDHFGLAMVFGLVIKELPFLILMITAALPQVQAGQRMRVAAALGHDRLSAWTLAVVPDLYRQIRLPVYLVLAFGMSVVDVALILGPTTPPPLSVLIVKWMGDPDIAMRMTAAAGAILQLGLVIAAIAGWRLAEIAGRGALSFAIAKGMRRLPVTGITRSIAAITGFITFAAIAVLMVWSVAGQWQFPDAWPAQVMWRGWDRFAPALADTFLPTLLIAASATVIALVATLAMLETNVSLPHWLIYLPLIIPQTAFLPGLQVIMLTAGIKGGTLAVLLVHFVFVLPYALLTLGGPWQAWDTRYARSAAAMGAGPLRIFWQIRLPMLLAPVLTTFVVCFAVSVGQYLPTLLIGGGRIATLTTEAVALAAGGDRRAIGVFATAQIVTALFPFAIAAILPAIVWRNRRGMA